ncbi:hypothetical protein D6745_00650 [Candidatus Woesearchaeota archaeon]|nr:MAG: hypothetical protein D6745_00650 [Candidatus Woesearchaeota archaeon]
MKHSIKITAFLLLVFLASQLVGLLIINNYVDKEQTKRSFEETGQYKVVYKPLPYNVERPEVDESTSFIPIIIAILVGTSLFLLLMRFKKVSVWKAWYFLSVFLCMTIALAAFLPQAIALVISAVSSFFKTAKPNVVVHNLTEIFIYGGLAAIFVPIINMFSAIALLIIISVYDMIAVWKSKHMVKMAKFQSKTKIFAGLFIPYKKAPKPKKGAKTIRVPVKNAVLGGGDIAFPLIFAGVVMKQFSFAQTLIIPVFVTLALLILFIKAEKDKFYPAMPFVTAGCILGYFAILLI